MMAKDVPPSVCFLYLDINSVVEKAVVPYAQSKCQQGDELVVLMTECAADDLGHRTLFSYMVEILRQYGGFPNLRTTVLSVQEHYQALQLCTARVKQVTGDFAATAGEVAFNDKQYRKSIRAPTVPLSSDNARYVEEYADFLAYSNTTNYWDILHKFSNVVESDDAVQAHLAKSSFLVCGAMKNTFVKECLSILFKDRQVLLVATETPLDSSLTEDCNIENISVTSELISELPELVANSANKRASSTTEYMACVVNAFVRILVNSRDELALALAMASPVVGLPHNSFTELKRVSLEKKMPMCQTAVSYVVRAKLGGNIYAAPTYCPLKPYLCKLTEFVDLLHQLQTIIEEENDTATAVRKVLSILVGRIKKSVGHGLVWDLVLNFKNCLLNLTQCPREMAEERNTSEQLNGRSGEHAIKVLRNLSDVLSTRQVPSGIVSALQCGTRRGTPLTIPEVLDYFRSPESEDEDDEFSEPLAKRLSRKLDAQEVASPAAPAGHDCTFRNETTEPKKEPLITDGQPRKKLLEVSINIKANTFNPKASKPERRPVKNVKRKIFTDSDNSTKDSKPAKKSAKVAVSQRLSQDQKKITSFFTRT